nr:hypothetical protein CFP56_13206 [Quercus suber]
MLDSLGRSGVMLRNHLGADTVSRYPVFGGTCQLHPGGLVSFLCRPSPKRTATILANGDARVASTTQEPFGGVYRRELSCRRPGTVLYCGMMSYCMVLAWYRKRPVRHWDLRAAFVSNDMQLT